MFRQCFLCFLILPFRRCSSRVFLFGHVAALFWGFFLLFHDSVAGVSWDSCERVPGFVGMSSKFFILGVVVLPDGSEALAGCVSVVGVVHRFFGWDVRESCGFSFLLWLCLSSSSKESPGVVWWCGQVTPPENTPQKHPIRPRICLFLCRCHLGGVPGGCHL